MNVCYSLCPLPRTSKQTLKVLQPREMRPEGGAGAAWCPGQPGGHLGARAEGRGAPWAWDRSVGPPARRRATALFPAERASTSPGRGHSHAVRPLPDEEPAPRSHEEEALSSTCCKGENWRGGQASPGALSPDQCHRV